jgi:hypothetical protein
LTQRAKAKQIHFEVQEPVYEQLMRLAGNMLLSRSELLRKFIKLGLLVFRTQEEDPRSRFFIESDGEMREIVIT